MLFKHLPRFLLAGVLLISLLDMGLLQPTETAQAQQPSPFLITPYWGTKTQTAYFDHQYPTYTACPNANTNGLCPPGFPNMVSYTSVGRSYDGHDGNDFWLVYQPVLAAANGIVTKAQWDVVNCHHSWNNGISCGYGLTVEILHSNGYYTRYGHLSAVNVSLNQQVTAGQIIGTSGNTGNSSAAHLHFGVLTANRQPIDPFGWSGQGADPWQVYSGVGSWCMWSDGEWANICGGVSHPIVEPLRGSEIIVNVTTDNTGGFSKGFGGLWVNPCTGNCGNWTAGGTYYSTPADGANGDPFTVDNWAKWQPWLAGRFYEVLVYVPTLPVGLGSWQAVYDVLDSHGGVLANAKVDEYRDQNDSYAQARWLSLGIYYLQPGSLVWAHDATGESQNAHCGASWCQLGVDSVKFIQRGTVTYLPFITR